jgi:hypothetical protein
MQSSTGAGGKMTTAQPGDVAWDPAEFSRRQTDLLEHAAGAAPPGRRAAHLRRLLRDEVLGGYDERFLAYDDELRRRIAAGTREVLDAWLTDEIRAGLPVGHRMRAFCIQHDLVDELTRLVADEAAGHREGAVVVGGRVYALYPYLRGVPRQDADITGEVGVEHRLDGVCWTGAALRIHGRAVIERVAARDEHVEIVLRERATGTELRIDADLDADLDADRDAASGDDANAGAGIGPAFGAGSGVGGFTAAIGLAGLRPGRWDVHVSVHALGLVRQAPLGAVKGPGLGGALPHRPEATAYFTGDGHLAIAVPGWACRIWRGWWRRRGRRRHQSRSCDGSPASGGPSHDHDGGP